VEELTGRTPIYFRPPRKLFNADILKLCQDYGYKMILWTVCLENKKATTPSAMAERVAKKCRPGAIILAHDGRLDRSLTVKALPLLIEKLHGQGYQFVTLEELLTKHSRN
jgi:peptidoglycan/xylan/chitin deacetylase (PgdA/CDA1 family)